VRSSPRREWRPKVHFDLERSFSLQIDYDALVSTMWQGEFWRSTKFYRAEPHTNEFCESHGGSNGDWEDAFGGFLSLHVDTWWGVGMHPDSVTKDLPGALA